MGKLLGVHTSNVQRDYPYEWPLAGLYGNNPLMRAQLVLLKGGKNSIGLTEPVLK